MSEENRSKYPPCNVVDRHKLEEVERWREWVDNIPPIQFPAHWRVRIIPPFGGAIARFLVEGKKVPVSVYLDVYERLGIYGGEPHWEVYPDTNGSNARFGMYNIEGLLAEIAAVLEQDGV